MRWSVAGLHGTYGDDAVFHGPFGSRDQAWAVAEQSREQARAGRLVITPEPLGSVARGGERDESREQRAGWTRAST